MSSHLSCESLQGSVYSGQISSKHGRHKSHTTSTHSQALRVEVREDNHNRSVHSKLAFMSGISLSTLRRSMPTTHSSSSTMSSQVVQLCSCVKVRVLLAHRPSNQTVIVCSGFTQPATSIPTSSVQSTTCKRTLSTYQRTKVAGTSSQNPPAWSSARFSGLTSLFPESPWRLLTLSVTFQLLLPKSNAPRFHESKVFACQCGDDD